MPEGHRPALGEYYCPEHRATFEGQEARRNNGDCPWCGDDVSGVVGDA